MQETPNHPAAQQRGRAYTDSAIAQNTQGALTDRQRQAFLRTHTLGYKFGWTTGIVTWMPNYFFLLMLVDAGVMSPSAPFYLIAAALSIVMGWLVAGPVGNGIWRTWARRRLKPIDTVVPVAGEIVYTPSKRRKRSGQHSFRAGGRLVKPVYGYTGSLENGAYTFYVVRGTRLFVNAQRNGSLYNRDDYMRLLSRAHGFNLEALAHNRDGLLTKGQRRQLTRTGVNGVIGAFILATGVSGGLLFLQQNQDNPENMPLWFALSCTIGITFVAINILITQLARVSDGVRGTVNSASGKLRKRMKEEDTEGETTYSYWYDIDGLSFQVTYDGYNVLEESREYIIYYTTHGSLRCRAGAYATSYC